MTRIISEAESIVKLPNFHWSLERYHAAIAAGVLNEYDKVELLFGKLIPMSPVGVLHSKTVAKITQQFYLHFSIDDFRIGIQDPVTLIDDSEPEPDLYIAKGNLDSYDHHPYANDLLLVVEVSDTTLNRDRSAKKLSYATAGVIEYWIVNVYERQIEQFTDPAPEQGDYLTKNVFKAGSKFTSSTLGEFQVDDLLTKK